MNLAMLLLNEGRNNILKKKEFIFIGGILILALAMWGGMFLINKGSHGSIRITVDGEEYGTYSLEKGSDD